MLHVFVHKYIIVHYQHNRIIIARKNKNLEKLFRENKTSPLLKTPEKDFHKRGFEKENAKSLLCLCMFIVYC